MEKFFWVLIIIFFIIPVYSQAQYSLQSNTINELDSLKKQAVKNEDYKMAAAIKAEIKKRETVARKIKQLEEEKEQAVAEEDYKRAAAIKKEIIELQQSLNKKTNKEEEQASGVKQPKKKNSPLKNTTQIKKQSTKTQNKSKNKSSKSNIYKPKKNINRLIFSIGIFSPQKMMINSYTSGNFFDLHSKLPPVFISYENRLPSSIFGYSGGIGFKSMNFENSYSDCNSYMHILVGGSIYLYPDALSNDMFSINEFDIFGKISLGVEYMSHSYSHTGEGSSSNPADYYFGRNDYYIPYLSVYIGTRYLISNKMEFQFELGYRELAIIKLGLNYKF